MSPSISRRHVGGKLPQVICSITKKQRAREVPSEHDQQSTHLASASDDDMSDDSKPLTRLSESDAVSRWPVRRVTRPSTVLANCRIIFDDESSCPASESEDDEIIDQIPISYIAQQGKFSLPTESQDSSLDDSDEEMPLWMISVPNSDKRRGIDERGPLNFGELETSDDESPLRALGAYGSSSCSSPSSAEKSSSFQDASIARFAGDQSEAASQAALSLHRLKAELTEFLRLNSSNLFRQQHRDKKQLKLKWAGSFKVGSGSTQPGHLGHLYKGRPGFVRHNIQSKNTGVLIQGVDSQKAPTFEQKKAYSLASAIIEHIDSDYVKGEFVVQFALMNDGSQYTKKHVDREDITYQYHLSLGAYTGAKLRLWAPNDQRYTDFDNLNRIVKFDGRLPHEVITDHFRGDRFSVIYYKNYDHRVTEPMPIFTTPQFVG